MDADQLRLFRQVTLDYFAKVAPATPPILEEPFLRFGQSLFLDRAAVVSIRGHYAGWLYLTVPNGVLESLLTAHGEAKIDGETLADVCREVSNVLAGNASQAFGGDWEISVPRSLERAEFEAEVLPPSSFVMPIVWGGGRSLLVVALARREELA